MNEETRAARAMAWAAALLAAAGIGCEAPVDQASAAREPIIYGEDDREDLWEHDDPAFAERARESSVALVMNYRLHREDPDDILLLADSLGSRRDLCPEERFVDQNTAAFCSGTLIDHDLVLTAGHCFGGPDIDDETLRSNCRQTAFVFNYHETADGEVERIRTADVYGCQRVLARAYDAPGSFYAEDHDYAIVQLDRPARWAPLDGRGHPQTHPAGQLEDRSVPIASNVVVIGHPAGLPAKIDDGGFVLYSRPPLLDFFGASADLFGSSSGSGVYDASGTLIGIAVRAQNDYRPRFDGACNTVLTTSQSGATGSRASEATYVRRAIDDLCEGSGFPSPLCGRTPACGDGVCSGPETHGSCAADCDPPTCGDSICHPQEQASCVLDCGGFIFSRRPPSAWTCDADTYNAADGCDCACGAYDPDCDRQPSPAFGCEAGERCGGAGTCESDPATSELPAAWTCFGASYGIGDGCHCGCGAPDPDCADPTAEVIGCEAGEVCRDAVCASEPAPPPADAGMPVPEADGGAIEPPPASGGCRVATSSGPRGFGLVLLLALAWRIVRRRRGAV